MNNNYFVIVVCVVLTTTISGMIRPTIASEMAKSSEIQVLTGNSLFTNNLYKVLADKEPGNVFFSPISAHAVLSMAYQGADGTTAQAFKSTLNVPEARSTAEGYRAIITRLNTIENVTLLMANKVYVMEGQKLLDQYKQSIFDNFLSDVESLNFRENIKSAETINNWVKVKTHDKINDLISSDSLDQFTRLVLVNAIYFKGMWLDKFDKNLTRIEPFYFNSNDDNDKIDVEMMHLKKKFNYKLDKQLDAQVLELPYSNRELSMIIILPNKRDGIKDLEMKLSTIDLQTLTDGMWNTDVNVALPKFKIEQTLELAGTLTKMGLGEIFDENKANFRGIIELKPNENLYVSKVIQKAFIEVNEEGAEAAAATGLVFSVTLSLPIFHPEERFNVDHPFIFLIKQDGKQVDGVSYYLKAPKAPLFMGKIIKPF